MREVVVSLSEDATLAWSQVQASCRLRRSPFVALDVGQVWAPFIDEYTAAGLWRAVDGGFEVADYAPRTARAVVERALPDNPSESPAESELWAALRQHARHLWIAQQVEVCTRLGLFRLDVAIRRTEGARPTIGVEVDGAEWHSSPAQLRADAQRDRALAEAGVVVIRFRGSEVYRDPVGCALEAVRVAEVWCNA